MSEYNLQLQRLLYRNGFDHRAAFILMCKGNLVDTVLVIGLVALVSGVSTVFFGLWSFRTAIRPKGCVALVMGGVLIVWGVGLVGSAIGW
jgi:hypothetical protein